MKLLPFTRLSNARQAHWPDPAMRVIEALYLYLVVYGGQRLWNVRAGTVAHIVDGVVAGLPGLRAHLDGRTLCMPFAD